MLTINILEKKYTTQLILEKINLKIDTFGIYGLVGKNGQGKTTLFKCILGLENYKGESYINNSKIALKNVAWCPAEPSIYGELTAKEFYEFYKNLLDLNETIINPLFEVPENKLIREFSTGMKKKVYLIKKSKESIIIISSHIMDILYNNCKQIFVVNNKSLTQFEKENFNHIQKLIFE